MKKIFIPLMTVAVVAALLLGCMPGAPPVTPPPVTPPPVTPPPVTPPVTPPPAPAAPLKAGDIPELEGLCDPDLLMNPFGEDFAVKPDGTPYEFAITFLFLGADPVVNYKGIMTSLIRRAGGEVTTFDAEFNAQKQTDYIDDLITVPGRMPDGLIVNAVNEQMLAPAVDRATAAGLPCFAYDIRIYSDNLVSLFWRDFTGVRCPGSDVMGEYFIKRAEEDNKHLYVYEVWGWKVMETAHQRHEGFHNAVDGHPLITVIESPDTQWSPEISANFIIDAFTTNPDLNAVYNHGSGLSGIPEGLRGIDRLLPYEDPDHVLVGTNDCDSRVVENMEKGYVDAFLTHGGWHLGDGAVKLMLTCIVCGKPVPKEVLCPTFLVTPENIDTEFFFGALSYPKMPLNQWDIWPALDTTEIGIEAPTLALRMEYMGY